MNHIGAWVLLAIGCAGLALATACTEMRSAEPRPLVVAPGSVEAGSAQWITIEGEGFEPLIHVEGREGAVIVDVDHRVRIGDTWSERVFWNGGDSLVVQLPKELTPGLKDVTVVSPSGAEGTASGALCAGDLDDRRILFLWISSEGIPNLCEVADSSRPSFQPRVIMPNSLLDVHRPTVVSGSTGAVVALQWVALGGALRAQVVALYPWREGHENDPPIVLRSAPLPEFDRQIFSMPVLTRDGGRIVYTEDEGRRLLSQRVPGPGDEAEDPRLLWEEPEDSPFEIRFPDVDPAGRRVVFSRIRYVMPECDETRSPAGVEPMARAALWQVPIEGGEALPLLDEEGVSNGPAAFLPSGDRIVFMSDRLGMLFPINEQCMASVVNPYIMDLAGGLITPVTAPTAMSPFGPPQVSPDGRWVATAGYLADTLRNAMDVLLIDLEDGEVYRAAAQASGVCSTTSPEACSSMILMPTFTADSKALLATGLPLAEGIGPFLLEVILPEDALELPSYDRTLPRSHVTFFGRDVLAARARDFYAGCEDR